MLSPRNPPALVLALSLAFALGCRDRGKVEDDKTTEDSAPPTPLGRWEGVTPGGGLGSSLAAGGGARFAGAPWAEGGAVWRLGAEDQLEPVPGAASGAFGRGLAVHDGALIVGAPLAESGSGLVWRDGLTTPGEPGELLGAAVRSTALGLIVSAQGGARQDERVISLGARVTDAAAAEGALLLGTPSAEDAVYDVTNSVEIARLSAQDEAGAALCAADLDLDGDDELAVGAPGLGAVVVLEAGQRGLSEGRLIQGSGGRFGQALACGPGLLVIGAPLEGDGQRGAVYAVEAGDEALVALGVGEADGAELGAAVLIEAEGGIFAGAPGQAGGAGLVVQLR
ncbi:hypothetical protein L6R46_27175 [Myxococcota bacterium]|nr:hypothetical protein [Myxococcota bacterium]